MRNMREALVVFLESINSSKANNGELFTPMREEGMQSPRLRLEEGVAVAEVLRVFLVVAVVGAAWWWSWEPLGVWVWSL